MATTTHGAVARARYRSRLRLETIKTTAPVTNLAWTRWGVLAHNAPVAISNGCWGDDTGLSTMEPDVAHQIARLWRVRVGRVWDNAARVIDAAQ